MTDAIVVFYFGLFFALLAPLPPTPTPDSPKNQNFIKMKKMPGDQALSRDFQHMCGKMHM